METILQLIAILFAIVINVNHTIQKNTFTNKLTKNFE